MIGLQGDSKNNGSLIVNMDEVKPAEIGQPPNPHSGLLSAADEILAAFDSRSRDKLAHALNAFLNIAQNLGSMEQKEKAATNQPGHTSETSNDGGWSY